MIVYGGVFENGSISNEMLNFDIQFNDWSRLYFKQQLHEPFYLASCATVSLVKKQNFGN